MVWELAENEEYRNPLSAEMRVSPIDGCSKMSLVIYINLVLSLCKFECRLNLSGIILLNLEKLML